MVELKMFIPRIPHRPHNELATALARTFGGVTLTPSIGIWYAPNGEAFTEGVDVMTCYVPDTPEAELTIQSYAQAYKSVANQTEVLYSISGFPTFIKGE